MEDGEHKGDDGRGPDDLPEEAEAEDVTHTALPPRVEAWRRRSATGAILTGFALGLQQALETKRDDPTIVVQTSGDPPEDLPVEADFEYRRPRHSVVSVRPWLLHEGKESADPSAVAAAGSDTGDEPGSPEPGSDEPDDNA